MAIIGTPRSFHKKFKFLVEIDKLGYSGFQKCSEISAEIAKIEHFEGGALAADKSPGRVTFSDPTLERGATKDVELFTWFKEVANVAANAGLIDDQYKRNADVVQQDRDNKTLRRWRLFKAWPTKFVAGEWDNDADENVIEKVTLTFERFDLA